MKYEIRIRFIGGSGVSYFVESSSPVDALIDAKTEHDRLKLKHNDRLSFSEAVEIEIIRRSHLFTN
jgi:hypothetical protein